ncbi:4-coumarate--CoA ligase-like 7 [Mycena venus]|uniref:4-coumarate--CoA ligase-like 7 n=1 Tax=Mycena venus TaxID=2733690 RepID=A0A8H6Y8Y5_9AGAR|nr:4-coumarate--CoA ligase-like 7 [Mycena venus]
MPEFSTARTLPHIPDDVTVEQFILRDDHPARPVRPQSSPWLVADGTGVEVSLQEIQERTINLANGLHSRFGIGEDDVVLIFSGNHIEYPICTWAVHRLCAIISPCNPSSTVSELTNQLRQTRATLVIAHAQLLDVALSGAREAGIPEERILVIEEEDGALHGRRSVAYLMKHGLDTSPILGRKLHAGEGRRKIAFLCSSSGTTGKPKVVAISHFAFIAQVLQLAIHSRDETHASWDEQRYRPGDTCLAVLPFYHIYGLVASISLVLFSGMTVVVVPKFTFLGMLESIGRHKINHLMLVPPQVVLLCKESIVRNYDLSSVRVILCAAAPLSAELNEQLVNLFPDAHIGQAYGSTECTGGVSLWSTRSKRGFNGGQLLPEVVARVVKPDGTLCGYNEPGELLVKTPCCRARIFWQRRGHEGNICGRMDRLKEIIKVRGFQVAPAELEGCLLGHDMVADVCVVGMPESFSGEVPLAFVVPDKGCLVGIPERSECNFTSQEIYHGVRG